MFNEIIKTFHLQIFANAGDVVNTTTGTANAYTGAKTTTSALAPTLKTFYDTELLENARIEMFYAQFGKKQPLPAGRGKTVEWRKFNTFNKADKLEEGVIPNGQTMSMTSITDTIDQYGTYATVSDQLELHAYDDVILGAAEELGAAAALTTEWLIRDKLLTNANVFYCDNIGVLTGENLGAPLSASEMSYSSEIRCVLTPDSVAKVVAIFKKNRVPTINGKYVAVIHPSVAYELRKCDAWVEAHKYAAPEQIFNGEIGELHGVRFIESAFAPVLKGNGYDNENGDATYATFFFGKDSFGIIDPEGGAMEMIVKDKSEAGGPLNQFSTIGFKLSTNGAKILYPERVMRVMSCTSFSGEELAN